MSCAVSLELDGRLGEALPDFGEKLGGAMQGVIKINGDGVGRPAKAAASIAADAVAGCFEMMEGRELGTPRPLTGQAFAVQLGMPALKPDERAEMYRTWLISKGFHDILKGLRTSFEEAYLYLAFFQKKRIVGRDFDTFVRDVTKKAGSLPFVALIDRVGEHLTSPFSYLPELLSLQKARNCLEHRNGIVAPIDFTADSEDLVLRYPRIKVYFKRADGDVELAAGTLVDPGDEREEVQIYMKLIVYERRFSVGEHILLSSAEFIEIAMATCLIADDLVAKLPRMSEPGQ